MDPLAELVDALNLRQVGEYIFEGHPIDLGFPRLFGGHVLAQACYAASKTVEDKGIHSLHGYFLRPGDPEKLIRYEVDPIRNGRSFSTRRVVAIQGGRAIFNMSSSFQISEEGFDHQISKPFAPAPDGIESDLEKTRAYADQIPESIRAKITSDRAVEFRTVDLVHPFGPRVKQPEKVAWVRATGLKSQDPLIHKCLLAYASDFGLLATSLLPHGVSLAGRQLQAASLDHAMWFHRDFDMSEWILYRMDSPSTSGGRGFNRGCFFTESGKLVASVTQEGLIRRRPTS